MKAMIVFASVLLVSCAGSGPGGSGENQQRKMAGLLQKFDLWDLNGDGYLTEKEISDGLSAHQVQIPETPAEIMSHYDRNGDRKISMSEAQGALEG